MIRIGAIVLNAKSRGPDRHGSRHKTYRHAPLDPAVGFVLEGTLREDCIVNCDISDSWVHGLLRRDWVTHDEGRSRRNR